jgi:hypothetical protein
MQVYTTSVLVLLCSSWFHLRLWDDANFVGVVESLEIVKISRQRHRRIQTTKLTLTVPSTIMKPIKRIQSFSRTATIMSISSSGRCHDHDGIFDGNIPLISTKETGGKRTRRSRGFLTRRYGQKNDYIMNDSDGTSNETGNDDSDSDIRGENSDDDDRINTVQANATISTTNDNQKHQHHHHHPISDFLYGANYVHSQYLSILWKYSFVWSFAVTIPIGIALLFIGGTNTVLYDCLFRGLSSVLSISSAAARLLQLPLEIVQKIALNIWIFLPEVLTPVINTFPNVVAVPLVQILLSIRDATTTVITIGRGNNIIAFISSMVAILVWRPAVEEWQYRSILDKLLFAAPCWLLNSVTRKKRFTATVNDDSEVVVDNNNDNDNNLQSTLASPSSSVSMVEFIPTSSNNFTIIGNNNNSSSVDVDGTTEDDEVYNPLLPNKSTRILLGSLLFATTRLGWLSSDPADSIALSSSPYGFTIGFIQSILGHFSSQGLSDIRPGLRILILLLAIHQTVSTFFVAQHVFAGIYRRRGLYASIGAHVSWTVGKGTIFFRLLLRLWKRLTTMGSRRNNSPSLGDY